MKRTLIAALPALVLLAGCEQQDLSSLTVLGGDPELDRQIVCSVGACQERNAILAQHTLYDYHFQANSAQLNDLGQRDVAVLAEAYLDSPGPLNVQRGRAGADLYRSRVETVTEALRAQGVDTSRVNIREGLPGGEGLGSEDAVTAIQRSRTPVRSVGAEATSGMMLTPGAP
jgi:hypothetical protein